MKTSAGKKLLLCFRSAVEKRAIKSDSSKKFPVKTKEQSMVSVEKSLKSNTEKESTGSGGGGGRTRKKKSARRIFSQMAKAILFETYLNKKVGNGKVMQYPNRSESSLLERIEKISKLTNEKSSNRKQLEEAEIDKTVSSSDLSSSSTLTHSSSISSSSSSSSFSSSSSSWLTPEPKSSWISFSGRDKSFRLNSFDCRKQSKETKTSSSSSSSTNHYCIIGLCLLLFSLSVLVFWGKFCAILCTSTWFYFVSTTRRNDNDEWTVVEKSPEVDKVESKQYKKKVIMEGFLERNNKLQPWNY